MNSKTANWRFPFGRLLLLLGAAMFACLTAALPARAADEVYGKVMAELKKFPNRQPGTPGYAAALDVDAALLQAQALLEVTLTEGVSIDVQAPTARL